MAPPEQQPLRVLVANEDRGRLEGLARVAMSLDQEVVAREIHAGQVAEATRDLLPDIAVVGLHDHHTEHALELIGEIVAEGLCPVIAVTDGEDPEFVRDAARYGIFAYTSSFEAAALRGAIDVAMRRFAHAEQLEGALGRRALIERAKGVLMERHSVDEQAAFGMLRDQSRRSGQKVVAVSQALLDSHQLLSAGPRGRPQADGNGDPS